MKEFKPTRLLALALIAVATFVASCEKDKSESELTPAEQEEATVASTEADAETDNIYSEVFDNVMGVNTEVGMGGTGVFNGRFAASNGRVTQVDSTQCFIVTVIRLSTTSPFPCRVVVDFGTGCVGRDGRLRKGKIITTYTGRLVHPGSVATTTFEHYSVDSIQVQGTHIVSNVSTTTALKFNIEVQNGKLTHLNGNYEQWNGVRTITQIEGMATPLTPIDDVFNITGHGSGVVKRNNIITTWESQIIEPLRKRFTCRWIVKGQVKIIRHVGSTTHQAILDYGQGLCDWHATLTVNGVVHYVRLPL